MIFLGEIITCYPSTYTRDQPDLTVSNVMENSIGLKRDKKAKELCARIAQWAPG